MVKVQRLITLKYELNEKLKLEDNASALIEELLRKHYDFQVFEKHQVTPTELDEKAKELNLQLEELDEKKREIVSSEQVYAKLKKLGITNKFLIDRLKNIKGRDASIRPFKQLKDDYNIKEILALYNAWDILHLEKSNNETPQ